MAETRKPKKQSDEPAITVRRNRVEPVGRQAYLTAANAFLRHGFRDETVVLRWTEIVGPEIARMAQPLRFSEGAIGGVLTLQAEPGAAIFLQHESRNLIGRINTFLGCDAVLKLNFLQAPLNGRGERPRKPALEVPVPADDPALAFHGPAPLQENLARLAATRLRTPKPD